MADSNFLIVSILDFYSDVAVDDENKVSYTKKFPGLGSNSNKISIHKLVFTYMLSNFYQKQSVVNTSGALLQSYGLYVGLKPVQPNLKRSKIQLQSLLKCLEYDYGRFSQPSTEYTWK